MSGRWRDSLADTDSTDLAVAVMLIAQHINPTRYRTQAYAHPRLAVAGAIIRNHRTSLSVKSGRCGDYLDTRADDELLWMAVESIAHAAGATYWRASYLRDAEAALRTYWKRHGGAA